MSRSFAPTRHMVPSTSAAPLGGGRPLPASPASSHLPTTIGPGISVTGDVLAEQDLVLAGRVDGSIGMPNHALTVMPGGRLDGPVFARVVVVQGRLAGDITASELVEVLAEAHVEGDITSPRVYLDENASYRGRIDMRRADAAVRVAKYRHERKSGEPASS